MRQKGSLSISTNAIVVLIIAVIMLGLIIGLITRAFGTVEDQFEEKISQEPDPRPASFSEPITLSTEKKITRGGDQEVIKISLYNSDPSSYFCLRPQIECSNTNVAPPTSLQQYTAKRIAAGGNGDFILIFTMPSNAPVGQHVCSVVSFSGAQTSSGGCGTQTTREFNKDLIIEVR